MLTLFSAYDKIIICIIMFAGVVPVFTLCIFTILISLIVAHLYE